MPVIILLVLAVALGVALFARHQKAVAERSEAAAELTRVQTTLAEEKRALDAKLADTIQAAEAVQRSLSNKTRELEQAAAVMTETKATLDATLGELKDVKDRLATTEAALADRDAQIKELTVAKDQVDQHATDLQAAITDRDAQIAETKRLLASSEGDRAFLLKELKRLQNEKGDLERQFNDLLAVKAQVKKLKEQYAVTKRLDWTRRGFGELNNRKGGEILQRGFATPSVVYTNEPDLNVEFRRDQPATIVQPPNN